MSFRDLANPKASQTGTSIRYGKQTGKYRSPLNQNFTQLYNARNPFKQLSLGVELQRIMQVIRGIKWSNTKILIQIRRGSQGGHIQNYIYQQIWHFKFLFTTTKTQVNKVVVNKNTTCRWLYTFMHLVRSKPVSIKNWYHEEKIGCEWIIMHLKHFVTDIIELFNIYLVPQKLAELAQIFHLLFPLLWSAEIS